MAVSVLIAAHGTRRARGPIQKSLMHRGRRSARDARRDDREYREYLREEQRRQAGCIAGRMPAPLMRWALKAERNELRASRLRAANRDDDVLTTFEHVRHRRACRTGRQFDLPQAFAAG